MKNYAKEYGYTDLDFIIEEQRTRIHETAKQICPSHCYECNELFGNVDVDIIEPFCSILYDECPDNIRRCPLFKEKIKTMNIPYNCINCDMLILDIFKNKINIYCDFKYCAHYKNTSEDWERNGEKWANDDEYTKEQKEEYLKIIEDIKKEAGK